MDLDLTEYDQVDEIKLIMNNHGQMCYDGSSSKFLVTLSSCSDQASIEEANCENDFVFLPDPPPRPSYLNNQQNSATTITPRSLSHPAAAAASAAPPPPSNEMKTQPIRADETPISGHIQQVTNPLMTINNNGNNPFENCRNLLGPEGLMQQQQRSQASGIMGRVEACIGKPIGLIETNLATVNSNPNKLAELMQQIVTRSDSIYIAIPCAYCNEPVSCPPSDISSWLNHMNKQHNCKVCPVCIKLVGLGPKRDLEIMRAHVLEHIDEEWLDRRSMKVNFSYGLQQLWFSGARCGIKDA